MNRSPFRSSMNTVVRCLALVSLALAVASGCGGRSGTDTDQAGTANNGASDAPTNRAAAGEPHVVQALHDGRTIQQEYWRRDTDEQRRLRALYPEQLNWREKLRLLHLTVMEWLHSKPLHDTWLCAARQNDADAVIEEQCLIIKLISDLISEQSPYRSRVAAVWKGAEQPREDSPADIQGILRNASLTHLGCLEIIRVDEQALPVEIDFLPLDHIHAVVFLGQGPFRFGKVFYDDQREPEVVMIPALYGISWATDLDLDRDGNFIRFIAALGVDGVEFGLAVGRQDLRLEAKDGPVLVNLASLAKLEVTLLLEDPRFEQKCKARGWNPDMIRMLYKRQ